MNISSRLNRLEQKIWKVKKEIIIKLKRFSLESLGEKAIKRKPTDCPGCDTRIAEARGTAINGAITIECPADCPNL